MVSQSLILGYHGCDRSVAEKVVAGRDKLWRSERPWDWLGHGIYFWEDSPSRALRWAEDEARRRNGRISTPAVIGAVINVGNCLNLIDAEALTLVRTAHEAYQAICRSSGAQPARNHGAEMKQRDLDCAVIETLHQLRKAQGLPPFDTFAVSSSRGGSCIPTRAFANWTTSKSACERPAGYWGISIPYRTERPHRLGWSGDGSLIRVRCQRNQKVRPQKTKARTQIVARKIQPETGTPIASGSITDIV